ncbi:NAD(P)/FAD-dependent oxidoreductase [Streptomyces acidicola]|uniref:NAD(P)/FAD-dependent oxidoreductase n=1 Tax=Streptomyces acidicola TaxID=2596892 RepID=UPI0038293EDB
MSEPPWHSTTGIAHMLLDVTEQWRPQTYYAFDLTTPDRPPLEGSQVFDAVVVGAGFAGISAALEFASSGMTVVVLEREHVAAGASGRNGGILLLSEGTHLADAEEVSAVDKALGATARELVELAEKHLIDIDLRRGTIRLAITGRQARALAATASSSGASGGARFLNREELREHIRSARYTGGLYERDNITLNPHKLLEGLASLAEERGAVVAESSEVTGVEPSAGGGVIVRTRDGEVRAQRLVVAAGTGTGSLLPSHRKLLVTAYSQIAVTEPIDEQLLDSVLPSWAATSEIATFSRYFRRLPDNRLLFGIGTLFDSIAGPGLEQRIRSELRDTFPELGDVPFQSAWEGDIASTVEETPLLDRVAPSAVLTSSNGVLASWNAGRIAARSTDPAYAAYDSLRTNKHTEWPLMGLPEQLLKTGAKALFRIRDRL